MMLDRLTWRTSVGTANFSMTDGVRKDNIARSAFYQRACERLAAFEDTGLLPAEIVAMREEHERGIHGLADKLQCLRALRV